MHCWSSLTRSTFPSSPGKLLQTQATRWRQQPKWSLTLRSLLLPHTCYELVYLGLIAAVLSIKATMLAPFMRVFIVNVMCEPNYFLCGCADIKETSQHLPSPHADQKVNACDSPALRPRKCRKQQKAAATQQLNNRLQSWISVTESGQSFGRISRIFENIRTTRDTYVEAFQLCDVEREQLQGNDCQYALQAVNCVGHSQNAWCVLLTVHVVLFAYNYRTPLKTRVSPVWELLQDTITFLIRLRSGCISYPTESKSDFVPHTRNGITLALRQQ